jgi:opacity protein-like surface antigen
MKKLLSGAALAVLFASPAFAADAIMSPEPAPAPVVTAPAFDWTGFYVGAQLGYGWAGSDNGTLGADDSADGIVGGPHVGYNYDLGNWVVGAEIDYDFTDLDFGAGDQIKGIGRGKLKVGADLGRTLIYGTGGVAYTNAQVAGDDANDWGYTVGAGVDFAATDHVIVGAEYTYNKFDDVDSTGVDFDAHTFTARVGYKF